MPNFDVDTEVQDRIQAVADFLAKKGAKVSDRARPSIDTAAAFRVFGGLLMAGLVGAPARREVLGRGWPICARAS